MALYVISIIDITSKGSVLKIKQFLALKMVQQSWKMNAVVELSRVFTKIPTKTPSDLTDIVFEEHHTTQTKTILDLGYTFYDASSP